MKLLFVCLGGAVGSGARYLLSLAVTPAAASGGVAASFPWGTWLVNVFGCFVLQLVLSLAAGAARLSPATLLLLTTGFCGGFTTYSTFNAETTALFRAGLWRTGALYLVTTVLCCLLAGLLGSVLGRALGGK
jgi:CrcB protein